jgi:hypothetical protein
VNNYELITSILLDILHQGTALISERITYIHFHYPNITFRIASPWDATRGTE